LSEPGLYDYLRSAIRNWWLLLLAAGVCAVVAGALADRGEGYRSRATLALAPSPADAKQVPTLYSVRGNLTTTLAALAASATVRSDAAAAVAIDEAQQMALKVSARVVPDSLVVIFSVVGDRADLVTAFSHAAVDAAERRFESLYPSSVVVLLDPPNAAERLDNSPLRAASVAGTIGLGAGFLLGLVRDAMRFRWPKRPPN
jgi:hypothetical protein